MENFFNDGTIYFFLILIPLFLFAQKPFTEKGEASYYSDKFEGRTTASGERFTQKKLTAAHRTLPFGTRVKVVNLKNKKSVVVVINDRGPFKKGRIIDLSRTAAVELDFIQEGLADVTIEVVKEHDPKEYPQGRPSQRDQVMVEKSYYTIEVRESEPSGYGVQIGSYQESANLLGVLDHLKKAYKREVTVEVDNASGNKVYKIILGRFKSRDQAEEMKAELETAYPGCFVFDFSRS